MQVRFKKLHPDAITPTKATDGSAGFDLYVLKNYLGDMSGIEVYHTGISIEIPKNYVGFIIARSSITKVYNGKARLANCIGVIDSDYRGELILKFRNKGSNPFLYPKKERCGQLVIVPCPEIELIEADELSTTERGNGGFGSTGN